MIADMAVAAYADVWARSAPDGAWHSFPTPYRGLQLRDVAQDGRRVLVTHEDPNGLAVIHLDGDDAGSSQGVSVPGVPICGAFSPDGSRLAIIYVNDGIKVGIADDPAATCRPVWHAPDGGWLAETTVAWSPDGLLLAPSWAEWDDTVGDYAYVFCVLDTEGEVRVDPTRGLLYPPVPASWNDAGLFAFEDVDETPLEGTAAAGFIGKEQPVQAAVFSRSPTGMRIGSPYDRADGFNVYDSSGTTLGSVDIPANLGGRCMFSRVFAPATR